MAEPPDRSDFGGRMKRLREQRGVLLRDIADRTRISVATLEALERNDTTRMPGGIFSRAIVRAYAHEIGADPERSVAEFVGQAPLEPIAASDGGTRRGTGTVVAIGAAILVPLALILVWSLLTLR